MSGFEARRPCPACVGTRMKKFAAGPRGPTLDHCRRCGGIWFDRGEVRRLRALPRRVLGGLLTGGTPRPMLCHSCRTPVARDAERCGACGWALALDCPLCAAPMRTEERGGVRLDFCAGCRGAWFDRGEVAAVWTAALAAAAVPAAGSPSSSSLADGLGAVDLGEVLFHAPELAYYGVRAGVEVAGAAARGIGQAPDALLAAGEGAVEVAGSAFSFLLEILGGLFDGIGF